jgi:hypothetical protein
MAGVQFLAGGRDYSLLHRVHTGSGAYPTSYLIGTRGGGAISLGVKWPRRKFDHSPPYSAKVKNGGAIPPLPYTSTW